jgi:hypothetical protein
MANNYRNITAANASSILIVEDLFPVGIELMMYSTDQALSTESVDITETRLGVDGKLVAGFTPNIQVVTISLEASSPSTESLNKLYDAMTVGKKIFMCTLVSTVPSIATVFKWSNGVLKNGTPVPAQKKVLDPTTWTFNFESFERSRI